jgi:nitrogen fixation/metabolism regulation signal transduction histidine kinase
MSAMEQNRRRRYLIDRGFQSKYVALLVVFIVALGIAALLILVLGSGETQDPQAKTDLRGAIFAMLAVLVVFMGLTIWYGLRFTHRLVGPVYAITRHLNWIQDGNYTRDLKLREKDEFQNIAAIFNGMQAMLRQRARTEIDIAQRVEAGLTELAAVLAASDWDREQAADLIKRLRKDLAAARVQIEGYITQ